MGGLAAGAILGGGIISAIGSVRAGEAEAEAQRANAAFFREQGELARISSEREESILQREGDEIVGAQIGAFAKAGVSLSGSALLRLAQTQTEIAGETFAIREERRRRTRLAMLRAEDAERQAHSAKKIGRIGAIGSILGGIGGAAKNAAADKKAGV